MKYISMINRASMGGDGRWVMSECKCTMSQKLVGDGCRYCNPQYYIYLLEELLGECERVDLPERDDLIQCILSVGQQSEGVLADAILSMFRAAKGVKPRIDMQTQLIKIAQTHRDVGDPLTIDEIASIMADIERKNMHKAAPEQKPIKLSDRRPTTDDADCLGQVWACRKYGDWRLWHWGHLSNPELSAEYSLTHWFPTGLVWPQPPGEDV